MKEHKYLKEEFHRGEWKPLMIKKGNKEVQAYSRITMEQAESMNKYANDYKIRYVLDDKKKASKVEGKEDLSKLREKYEELAGKKAFHGWDAEKLTEKIKELQ